MKKIVLLATICVAGLVSAKGMVENNIENQSAANQKDKEAEKPLKQLCSTITINIMCDSSQSFNNTYCWTEGNTASFQEALHCYETEYQMFNDELCN
jgi:hypothetical protein